MEGQNQQQRVVVHLQCPLCAEVLQHHCLGRVQIDDEPPSAAAGAHSHTHTHTHAHHPSRGHAAAEVQAPEEDEKPIHAAALEADEESLREGGAWEMDPALAERFRATAAKRARRKREREEEDKRGE